MGSTFKVPTANPIDIAEFRPDRTAILFTVYDNSQAFGTGGLGAVVISDDVDATALSAVTRTKGFVMHGFCAPVLIRGETARRRWSAQASGSAAFFVGVLEFFDGDEDDMPTPTEKVPLTEEGAKV